MEVGNVMEVPTTIAVGVLPKTLSKIRELDVMIKKIEDEMSLLERSVKTFKNMEQSQMTKETEDWRKKVIQAKVIKTTELKQCQDEKIRCETLVKSGKDAKIIVQKTIFPGCRVEIADDGIEVRQELKHVKFVLRDGNIEAALLY